MTSGPCFTDQRGNHTGVNGCTSSQEARRKRVVQGRKSEEIMAEHSLSLAEDRNVKRPKRAPWGEQIQGQTGLHPCDHAAECLPPRDEEGWRLMAGTEEGSSSPEPALPGHLSSRSGQVSGSHTDVSLRFHGGLEKTDLVDREQVAGGWGQGQGGRAALHQV